MFLLQGDLVILPLHTQAGGNFLFCVWMEEVLGIFFLGCMGETRREPPILPEESNGFGPDGKKITEGC